MHFVYFPLCKSFFNVGGPVLREGAAFGQNGFSNYLSSGKMLGKNVTLIDIFQICWFKDRVNGRLPSCEAMNLESGMLNARSQPKNLVNQSCLWIFILLYSGIKLHCPALGPLVKVERDLVGKKLGFCNSNICVFLLLQLDTPMLDVKYQR